LTDAIEVVIAVTLSSLIVAALNGVATTAGLSVIYLLGVLVVAVRRGSAAAMATATLGVLALNYFFIEPVHRLTIRESENVVALVVFLLVGLVVGALAAQSRARAAEAERRAREAAARREEAEMLAEATALLLGDQRFESRLPEIGPRLARALGLAEARLQLGPTPAPRPGERAVAVPARDVRAWLLLGQDEAIEAADLERVLASLAALVDVAAERERVAQQAAATESTRRADAVKTAVLHAISHDLRSPLTAIRTAADALAAGSTAPEEHDELLAVVREESERLTQLVEDVLDLSRIEAQAVHPQVDWCDLHDVISHASSHVDGAVEIELPADLPLVRADHAQLERVLANLVDNAVRLSPPGRPVRITGGVGGGMVTVRVLDEGPGVPAAQRTRIFEPFQRGEGGRDTVGRGAGLGLAICKGFVEANGGRILHQPNPLGRGSAFAVSLPLVAQPAALP
jgi:two-component system, OmpR family, sensor histidine kinase KdpD